jgi:DNA-directed RNA polymerase alpha subunit
MWVQCVADYTTKEKRMLKTIPGVFLEAGVYSLYDLKRLMECATLIKACSNEANERSIYPSPDPAVSLSAWDLSVRCLNVLKAEGIFTPSELVQYTYTDLLKMINMGRKSANEIVAEANKHGFRIKDQPA